MNKYEQDLDKLGTKALKTAAADFWHALCPTTLRTGGS